MTKRCFEIDNCNVVICLVGRHLDGWMRKTNLRTEGDQKTNWRITGSRRGF